MENLNTKKEKFEIKLTEWEIDIIRQSLEIAKFPGTHIHLTYDLIQKINDNIIKHNEKEENK